MQFFTKNIRWLLPICILVGAGCMGLLLSRYDLLTYQNAVKEAVTAALILIIFISVIIYTILAYPTKAGIYLYAAGIGLLGTAAIAYLDIAIIRLWSNGSFDLLAFVEHTIVSRIAIAFAVSLPTAIVTASQKEITEIKQRLHYQNHVEQLLKEAELFKLRQQLQPHFMYNSLNSINALIMIDAEQAQEMVGKLSDFLRNAIKQSSNEPVSISEEISYLENYLSIEAFRFGDRLNIVYHFGHSEMATIPALILQPVMENAIKYGLYGNTGEVTITITTEVQNKLLTITVNNPYDNSLTTKSGTGFGLEGIRRRLYLIYGRNDLLEIRKEENNFTTTLKIPQ